MPGIARATSTVRSFDASSTRMTSSTHSFGTSCQLFSRVLSALYAGITTATRFPWTGIAGLWRVVDARDAVHLEARHEQAVRERRGARREDERQERNGVLRGRGVDRAEQHP